VATTLDNVHIDRHFYHFLKGYVFPDLKPEFERHHLEMIEHGLIQIDAMLELAISRAGNLQRKSTHGMDFVDGSDSKKVTSNFRMNSKSRGKWVNSYKVANIRAKKGMLRIMGFNHVLTDQNNGVPHFDFYAIPYEAYSHLNGDSLDIILDNFTGYFSESSLPALTGLGLSSKWEQYRCADFESMALTK
jgi:hypothetical protein